MPPKKGLSEKGRGKQAAATQDAVDATQKVHSSLWFICVCMSAMRTLGST
jgi:hypothetical protein